MNRIIKSGLVALLAATLVACGSDDGPVAGNAVSPDAATNTAAQASPKNDAVTVAQAEPALSLLVEAVVAADLAGALSGPGPLTIFAPTNDAFSALLAELNITKDQLLADKALLTQVLTYHVLDGEVKAADVPVGQAIASLSGAVFKVSSPAQGGLVINDGRGRMANITATDIMADNAVIHLIDKVILPADKTIVQQAQSLPGFSILVQAVLAADLADTLSGPGPFTVFAPTDTAFADLLAELGLTADALLADKALLTRVLTYHVVPGLVLAGAVPLDTDIGTVEGNPLRIDGSLAITDGRARQSNIVATDVLATNGVIHVIDKVLLPPQSQPASPVQSLVGVASADSRFSLLVEAVVAADLVSALEAPGPLTVFAPTNDAFVALLGELHTSKEALFADTTLLRDVLLYHVLPGQVLANQIPFDTHLATAQGGAFSINAHLQVTDARHRQAGIVATDVLAANGVIHVIDKVLLPH